MAVPVSQYTAALINQATGAPMLSQAATILNPDLSPAILYTDGTGVTVAGSNAVASTAQGNLTFFATPAGTDGSGVYVIRVAGQVDVSVQLPPRDSALVHVLIPSGGDDTTAINNALTTSHTVRLRGAFSVSGRVTVSANNSLLCQGGGWPGAPTVASITLTASGAGVDVVGGNGGEISNLLIDANHVANLPLQRLLDIGGGGGFKEFRNVVVFNAVQDNWTFLGPQNDTVTNCQSFTAGRDNLVIDKGTGGTHFTNWEDGDAGRYGIHIDALVAGGPFSAGPQQIQFAGGRTEHNGTPGGTSQIYMRHATDIAFTDGFAISGGGNSGPVVDIDMATCNLIDMEHSSITSSTTGGGANPGHIALQTVNSGGNLRLPWWFVGGDTSWYAGAGTVLGGFYATVVLDASINGMVAAGGVSDPNTLIRGRPGPWVAPTLLNSWANESVTGYPNAGYRITATGELELRGGIKSGASGSVAFVVPLGYRPISPGLYVNRIGMSSGGVCAVQVEYTGNVRITQLTGNVTTLTILDGLTFPLMNIV